MAFKQLQTQLSSDKHGPYLKPSSVHTPGLWVKVELAARECHHDIQMVHRDARRPALINMDNPRIACEKAQQLDSSFPLMSIYGFQTHCDLLQLAPVRWEYRGFVWNPWMWCKAHISEKLLICFRFFTLDRSTWLSVLNRWRFDMFWLSPNFRCNDPNCGPQKLPTPRAVLCGGVHLGTDAKAVAGKPRPLLTMGFSKIGGLGKWIWWDKCGGCTQLVLLNLMFMGYIYIYSI